VQLLPLIVVVAILAIRLIRPQRISVMRMWITPIVLCLLTGWVIYANELINPARPFEIAIGLIVGAAAGVPFGILRGMHTDVRPTGRRGVMYLGSSWITLVIFAAAFGLRYAVRAFMPQRGSLNGTIGDGLLAFAIAFLACSYVVIFRKYEALVSSQVAPARTDPGEG
jgi:hypothetical protein